MQKPLVSEFVYNEDWLSMQPLECGETALLAAFAHFGIPETFLDLGCGNGHLCHLAARLGVEAVGIDIALPEGWQNYGRSKLAKYDLREPLDLATWWRSLVDVIPGALFDLVISWETGEHIPEQRADTYLDTIVRHTGKTLIFTAAKLGQGGDGHINCQDQEWWRERLCSRGLVYLPDATEHLRETWKWSTGACSWYPQNVQVFSVKES